MNPLCTGPLDVLRTCLGFWPLEQRLASALISRRWQEAGLLAELWAELDVPAELCGKLPNMFERHGKSVRRLSIATRIPLFEGLPANLFLCRCLEYLNLRGLRGRDLTIGDWDEATMPSLRVLVLEHAPYFLLSRYSHHTGVPAATVPVAWVAKAFPNLHDLSCAYLQIDSPCTMLPHLKSLSFVAVVRDRDKLALWNTANCSVNLEAVAEIAPNLERIEVRYPQPHLGRMSCRPGLSIEDLLWTCRRFCATSLDDISGICKLFPRLHQLDVATLHDDIGAEQEFPGLVDFLGISAEQKPLLLRAGGSASFVSWLRSAVRECRPDVTLEAVGYVAGGKD